MNRVFQQPLRPLCHDGTVDTYQEYVVKAVAGSSKVWPRSKKEDERKRRKRRNAVIEFLAEEPEDALELSNAEPVVVTEKKRAVLATAESLVQSSMFCARRKATFEEQLATAALSPGRGCAACLCPDSLPRRK